MNKNIKNQIPQLQFSEFKYKNTWKSTSVSQLGKIITGKTPNTKTSIYWGNEYIWVTPTDITSKKYISHTERMITSKWIKNKDILPINTVLITCIASIGKNCILKKEGFCNQQINAIIPNLNKYNSDFIYYTFDINKHILMNNSGISATRILSKTKFEEINFLFPALQEQKKIADCLSSLDELIEAHEQKLDALKQHKKGLMQRLFPAEGETMPRWRFPEFRNNGEWKTRSLGSMTKKIGSGVTPRGGDKNYISSGIPFVRSQNIGWGKLLLDDIVFISYEIHKTFLSTEIQYQDILLNITGASIGRCAIANRQISGGNVNQHVCIIRTNKNELNPIFLMQYIISYQCQNQINNFQAGGNRQGLNFAQVASFNIPTTSLPEQQKIADILTSIDEQIEAQEEKIKALKEHKKGMMQQLFPSL